VLARSNPRNAGGGWRYTGGGGMTLARHRVNRRCLPRFLAICRGSSEHLMAQISIGDNHCTATVLSQHLASIVPLILTVHHHNGILRVYHD